MAESTIKHFDKAEVVIEQLLADVTEKQESKDVLRDLNKLKSENLKKMSTVLKEQTDNVITIAEEVQNLQNKIAVVENPTSQLREEIKWLKQRVCESVKQYDIKAQETSKVNMQQFNMLCLRAYGQILKRTSVLIEKYLDDSTSESEQLDRLASRFTFHNQWLVALNVAPNEQSEIYNSVFYLMRDQFLKAFKQQDVKVLRRLLSMYVFLDKVHLIIEIIKTDVVEPLLKPILTDEHLKSCGNSLRTLYQDALKILTVDLARLSAIFVSERITKVNFVLDCYWVVADRLLQNNVRSITAAGNADIFYKNFHETKLFIIQIATLAGNKNLLHKNESMIKHFKRFNLLVYYEIRHQEVSGTLESVTLTYCDFSNDFYANDNPQNIKLKVTAVFYCEVEYLFHEDVYIPILSDQFLKTLFLITARYLTWVGQMLVKNHELSDENARKYNLLCFLQDVYTVKSKLCEQIKNLSTIEPAIVHATDKMLEDVIIENNAEINIYLKNIKERYVLITKCEIMKQLQNITALPRLYRRTNREVPTECSDYVIKALAPIFDFEQYFQPMFDKPAMLSSQHRDVMDDIINSVTDDFSSLINEVLSSVSKMEESLKRLKFRNVTGDETRVDTKSDEHKIRLQIRLDAERFVKEMSKFATETTLEKLNKLSEQTRT